MHSWILKRWRDAWILGNTGQYLFKNTLATNKWAREIVSAQWIRLVGNTNELNILAIAKEMNGSNIYTTINMVVKRLFYWRRHYFIEEGLHKLLVQLCYLNLSRLVHDLFQNKEVYVWVQQLGLYQWIQKIENDAWEYSWMLRNIYLHQ